MWWYAPSRNFNNNLKRLLSRVFNKNQVLLLNEISRNYKRTITSLLKAVSKENKISLSTLKSNSKILKQLNLISSGNGSTVELTDFGNFINEIIKSEDND